METKCIFPLYVLEEIFVRLTVRQLLKMRCVCKSWCSIIDGPSFIKLHYGRRRHSQRRDTSLFCVCNSVTILPNIKPNRYYLVQQWDHLQDITNELLSDGASRFLEQSVVGSSIQCVGVVNGIVCLQWADKEIGLWNLSTREFKVVESWMNLRGKVYCNTAWHVGFGFDSVSNDFKIVSEYILERKPKMKSHCKLYSLNSNTWESISTPSPLVCTQGPHVNAYLNGVCYWPGETYTDLGQGEYRHDYVILSFNFVTNDFKIHNPPKKDVLVWKKGCQLTWELHVYKESIAAVICNNDKEKGEASVDIWVATEVCQDTEVALSWNHLIVVPQMPTFDRLWIHEYRTHGHFILFSSGIGREEECYSSLYNPTTNTCRKLEIAFDACSTFGESLFPLSRRLFRHSIGSNEI